MSDGLIQAIAAVIAAFIGAIVSGSVTNNKYWLIGGGLGGAVIGFIIGGVFYSALASTRGTPTPTVIPGTDTNIATQQAVAIASTQQAINAMSTQQAVAIASTQQAINAMSTQQAVYIANIATHQAISVANTQQAASNFATQQAIGIISTQQAIDAIATQRAVDIMATQQAMTMVSMPKATPTAGITPEYHIENLTRNARVYASSVYPSKYDCYSPYKLIDGNISGDGDESNQWGEACSEWASNGEKKGATVIIYLERPVYVSYVELYDRPNNKDWIWSGELQIDEDEPVKVGWLQNRGGTPGVVQVGKVVWKIKFTVKDVGSETVNIGLAEIMVMGPVKQR